jgi:hypothetical protein
MGGGLRADRARQSSRRGRIRWAVPAGTLVALVFLASPGAQPHATGWQRIHHKALVGRGGVAYIHDVEAPSGRTWLAAGFQVDSDGVRSPSVWESGDGVRWGRVVLPPSPSTERRDGAYLLARRGSTVVAIGERFTDRVQNAAWFRSAGKWRALSDTADPLLSFAGRIVAVAATPTGFAAVGSLHTTSTSSARVFSSRDGRRWTLHSELPLAGEQFQALDIAASSDRMVVVGATSWRNGDGGIWIWTNGAWTRAPADSSQLGGPGRDQVAAVAYKPGVGFVAGGMSTRNGAEVPAGWISSDGLTWKRLPVQALPFPSVGAAVHDIAVTRNGFVAAGNTTSGALLWRSRMGLEWTLTSAPKAPHEGGESVRVAATSQVIVVTATGEHRSDVFRRGPGTSWVVVDRPPAFPAPNPASAHLRDVAVAGARLVAIGDDGRGRPLVMLSPNGRRWSRAPFADRAAELYAVSGSRGTIAVAGTRFVRGQPHVAIWTSTSGRRWERFGGTRHDLIGAFVDIAPDRRGFLALAFEASPRGLQTSVWSGRGGRWRTDAILGSGEARGLCVGPHGATAVGIRDGRSADQVVVWQRSTSGRWAHEPEVLATNADGHGCADAPFGTFVIGSDRSAASIVWSRPEPGARWQGDVFQTAGSIHDVTRDGDSLLISGAGGTRGQLDLVVWRLERARSASLGGGDPVFSAPGGQDGFGIVGYKGEIVVVGRSGAGDGAIWIGR